MEVFNIIVKNIPLLAICSVMIYISIRNYATRKKESQSFLLFIAIVLLLAVIVEVEALAIRTGNVKLATVFTFLGYSIRPTLLYIFLLLADMDRKRNKIFHIVSISLLSINLLINALPLFMGVKGLSTAVFYYELKDGIAEFHRGSFLNFSSHILSLVFLVVLLVASTFRFKGKHRRDGIVLLLCAIIIVITVIEEMIADRTDLLNVVCGICAMINYIFITSINSSRDPLTHLYDRRTYYEDITKYKKLVNGVIQIDMNELKYINDNLGHEEGDKALKSIAKACEDSIYASDMCVYRMSGDEYLILMFQGKEEELKEVASLIRQRLGETKYRAAIGLYYFEKGTSVTFEEGMKIAEELMYEDKAEYYKTTGHDRRRK